MTDPVLQRALRDADEGRLEAAIAAVRIVVTRSPRRIDARQALGMLLMRAGRAQQAIHHFQKAVEQNPQRAVLRANLANALLESGKPALAVAEFQRALEADPADRPAWHGLLLAQAALKDRRAWLATAQEGLRRWPDWMEFAHLHVHGLQQSNRIEEALDFMQGWLARHPDDLVILSSRAHMLNYRTQPRAAALAAHRAYGAALRCNLRPPRPTPDPDRPLRLGILSGDLRSHAVGFFAEPFLARCPADFTPVVFSTLRAPDDDATARRFRSLLPDWHEVGSWTGLQLDREIRRQHIDVLLDLAGHTWHHRLGALEAQPAPVIVHAIGYCHSTGHPAIGWRVVDSTTDPPGSEEFSTERLLRVDPCFLCYRPPADAPEPAFPPDGGPVTFGSFNNTAKVSPETIALWARVLAAVPGSRLLLKAQALDDADFVVSLREKFAAAGIVPERLEFLPFTGSIAEHLRLYARVHVALDPTPYNGTTTTCEAIWMGVPVVALAGDRHAARVSTSLLQAGGFPQWVAADEEAYVRLAAELAGDSVALRALRGSMRQTLAASPLLDADTHAARFHGALRQAWREWCAP